MKQMPVQRAAVQSPSAVRAETAAVAMEDAAVVFDGFAGDYDAALAEGLAASGEGKDYFAAGRVAWLRRHLERLGAAPKRVLDYGCGTGSATPYLLDLPSVRSLVGVDVSEASLEEAGRTWRAQPARFQPVSRPLPAASIDLAYCNGVFHHIPPGERAAAVQYVFGALRPGGFFAFWENNPWNPGTRYVMRRIPFDRDAITLTPPEAIRLLRAGGFEVLRCDFQFIFPRSLHWLRWTEPHAARLPLGGQYQVLCRKP